MLIGGIGVAYAQPEASRSIDGCIQLANEAFYGAKETGRDCIVIKERESRELTTVAFRQPAPQEYRQVS